MVRTNELIKADEDGFFCFEGRRDGLIVTGGYHVNPREVEAVINSLASTEKSAVVGIPDDRRGQTVKDHVSPESGHQATRDSDQIKEACLLSLAPYNYPREVEVRETLPETALG